jgi:hypothetical protein
MVNCRANEFRTSYRGNPHNQAEGMLELPEHSQMPLLDEMEVI